MAILECIPNFSEGRRPEVLQALAGALTRVPGVFLLDQEADKDHNRSVFTLAGEPASVVEAAFAAAATARDLIDLRRHQGEHPRIGATDVVPLVPIEGITVAEAVELARSLGQRIARELEIPVYLYEEAATSPARRNLADIRRGEFEGLPAKMSDPAWAPDFGAPAPHPSAGATVVGVRKPLVAFNVYLDTKDVKVAKAIAKAVRGSSGGLVGVKALGFEIAERGCVQVSMNLVDLDATPIYRAYELVRIEARRFGVNVLDSEIVGLVPERALVDTVRYYLGLAGFRDDQVLEARLGKAQRLGAAMVPDAGPGGGRETGG